MYIVSNYHPFLIHILPLGKLSFEQAQYEQHCYFIKYYTSKIQNFSNQKDKTGLKKLKSCLKTHTAKAKEIKDLYPEEFL